MSVIPCEQDLDLRRQIEKFAEVLKTQAHKLGDHGLSEKEFNASPIFRGAIQQVRGEISATMREKREFVQHVLNHMEDRGFIASWDHTRRGVLHDYVVNLRSGRIAIIDLKGCFDGDNTKLFGAQAAPTNSSYGVYAPMLAPTLDAMLGPAFIRGRSCPKLALDREAERRAPIGPFCAPPPCLYLFPSAIPSADNLHVAAQSLSNVEILDAFHSCFGGDDELNHVSFDIEFYGEDMMRRTTIKRGGIVQHSSERTAIRRG